MFASAKQSWTGIFWAMLAALLLYLLFWRFQVSATRFFDADEFSYMHWTAQVARGQAPYIDFFSYFTPGFMWALAPMFWIVGKSAAIFTVGRGVAFVIFLCILGAVGYLFGITRGWKWVLLPAVLLAFLPMPYDKFLEIRPDNLATLLALIGLVVTVHAMRQGKKVYWLVAGLAYSGALFVLVKTVPMVLVGGLGVLLSKDWKKIGYFSAGLLGPWVLFFAGAFLTGHLAAVWYSLTRLPFEAYTSVLNYPMEPHIFFFPNASFYGGDGHTMTAGLLVNHAIWVLAILVGAYRLAVPRRPMQEEMVVALTFFIMVIGYIKYFPAKHSQYLIPIAVFIAYYAADGLSVFFDWLSRVGGHPSLTIILLGIGYLLVTTTRSVNAPKLYATNKQQLAEMTLLLQTVPPAAHVVDYEGRMLFWTDGYPVCCVPIDGTLQFVTHKPPPLSAYLADKPAEYIYFGNTERLSTLFGETIGYIRLHYAPVTGWGERLWKRK